MLKFFAHFFEKLRDAFRMEACEQRAQGIWTLEGDEIFLVLHEKIDEIFLSSASNDQRFDERKQRRTLVAVISGVHAFQDARDALTEGSV